MAQKILVEVCANSVESAIAGQKGGADRIELCANLLEGGTTPSFAAIETARERLSIKLNVIIRPRGSDFLYNELEYSMMKRDIKICKNTGVDGVVIGILDKFGNIDKKRTEELVSIARPMSVTFHRAFDMSNDPYKALSDLIELGVDRILTSGQRVSVADGLELLASLVKKAGDSVIIMPGCGITSENIVHIAKTAGAKEYHMTGNRSVQSLMEYKNPFVTMGDMDTISEYSYEVTDEEEIRRIVSLLKTI